MSSPGSDWSSQSGPETSPPRSGGFSRRGIWIAVGAGCAILVLAAIVVAVGIFKLLESSEADPEGLELVVEAPLEVNRGTSFDLVIRVSNTGDARLRLGDLDVSDSYLDGFLVESVSPYPRSRSHDPINGATTLEQFQRAAAGR